MGAAPGFVNDSSDNRFAVFRDLALNLLHHDSVQGVLETVVVGAIERLGFDDCIIYLWCDEHQGLVPSVSHGGIRGQPRRIDALPLLKPGEGIVGSVHESRNPIRVSDTSDDARYLRFEVHGQSELAVPIVYGDRCLGVIDSEHAEKNYFSAAHEELLTLVASATAPKLHNLMTIDRLEATRSELQRSRDFIREIIDTAPNILYVLDYESKLMLEGMDNFASFFGFTVAEIEAMENGVYDLIHPDDIPAVAAQEERLFSSQEATVVPVEFRLRHKSGDYTWCLVSSKVFKRAEDGKPRMEVGSVMDISDLKAAQDELHQREKRVRTLIENCFDCIVLYDEFATIRYATPSLKRFMGFNEDEVIGKSALDFVVPEDHSASNRVWFDLLQRPGGHAVIEQRIRHKSGREIWIEARLTNHLLDPDIRGIVSNFHDITARKAAEQRINQLANYDSLTGFPNRRLLMDRLEDALERAKRHEASLTLMYMDLDRFKNVNDTLGHDVGDKLLVIIAHAAQQAVGARHTLARLGGDEFAVILENVSLSRGRKIARGLVEACERPFEVGDYEIRLTASVGLARYPDHGSEVEELFKHADIAMYRAKTERNRYAVFQARDARAMEARVALEKGLQQALENDTFELWYQPRVEIMSSRAVAVEALLRWRDADGGLVLPGDFVPVAEDTGLIYRIGEWVLDAACRQARQWRNRGHELRVAVNLSAHELMRPDIVDQVARSLARHGLPAEAIELEITETATMTDVDHSMRVLHKLRELGVGLAIDDFGTGYSSLSYLRELPVNCLKIDQAFLPRATADRVEVHRSVITGIVLMAQSLGLHAVAEGVETEDQHRFLYDVGCPEAQGYFYAKPMPATEIAPLLANGAETRPRKAGP